MHMHILRGMGNGESKRKKLEKGEKNQQDFIQQIRQIVTPLDAENRGAYTRKTLSNASAGKASKPNSIFNCHYTMRISTDRCMNENNYDNCNGNCCGCGCC